jgi:hypothetical protein
MSREPPIPSITKIGGVGMKKKQVAVDLAVLDQ